MARGGEARLRGRVDARRLGGGGGGLGWSGQAAAALLMLFGAALPLAGAGLWLWRQQALNAFVEAARGLMPYHAGMARRSIWFLLGHAVQGPGLLLVLPALALCLLRGSWRLRSQAAALTGMACGLASFCVQGKAYPYHRYPLLVFALLLVALELGPALRARAARERATALLVLAYGALYLGAGVRGRRWAELTGGRSRA